MAAPVRRNMKSWILDYVLWDNSGTSLTRFPEALWALRRVIAALLGSMVLTWWEWVSHHPPEIAIVAVIHFAFVLAAIALLVYVRQWCRRGNRKPQNGE
jgi:hypothetical protein